MLRGKHKKNKKKELESEDSKADHHQRNSDFTFKKMNVIPKDIKSENTYTATEGDNLLDQNDIEQQNKRYLLQQTN